MKNINLKHSARWVNILSAIVFAAAAFWLLAVDGENYLRKIESYSIFLPTHDFISENLTVPGGALTLAARFLTQMFYHPCLGGAIYVALLLAMAALAVKALRLSWRFFPALLLVPAVITLTLLNLGYLIFSLKTPGHAFLPPLGITVGLLMVWAYRVCGARWWFARPIAIFLIAAAGYCLMGFYGLLAAAICVVREVCLVLNRDKKERRKAALAVAVGAASIALVPKIWFSQIGGHLMISAIYTCQLPAFYEGEESHWTPYYFAFALLLALPLLGAMTERTAVEKAGKSPGNGGLWLSAGALLLAIAATAGMFKLRYNDANLKTTLNIDRALQNCEWQKAAEYAKDIDEDPTRLNVFLTHIALIRSGEAKEKLFKYRIASAEPNTERALRATHEAGSMMLSYHTGLINYAYRWAMETKVEYGQSAECLKYMINCALINGETQLAEKYIDLLSLTLFHKDWAEQHRAYLTNPKLMASDPQISPILPIATKADKFIVDKGQLEGYIWPDLAEMVPATREQLELSMISALICRDIQSFAAKVPAYMSKHKGRIPTHFQEAIMIWLVTHGVTDYKLYQIDDEIVNRCQEFMKLTQQYNGKDLSFIKDMAYPQFGDTYWYYFLLNTGFRII